MSNYFKKSFFLGGTDFAEISKTGSRIKKLKSTDVQTVALCGVGANRMRLYLSDGQTVYQNLRRYIL